MKLSIYPTKDAMSRATADLVVEQVHKKPDSLLCFPSGESPLIVLEYLVKYGLEGQVNFDRCQFVGLDEWLGMDEKNEGSCKHFLHTNFFNLLNIRQEQVIFFNGIAGDLDLECQKMDHFIKSNGPIDLMVVGLGLNGHIGLNEPGTDFNLYSHLAELDPLTVLTAQKYFKETTTLSGGITLGLKHFTEAKTAVLIVSGTKKADILAKVLEEELSEDLPGTIIQFHQNSYVFSDQEAASELAESTLNQHLK